MFGKKQKPKKATPKQQMAVAAAEFQGQIDAALQLPDPLESYERLAEIKKEIVETNESINTIYGSVAVLATKATVSFGTFFGGVVVVASGVNPIAGGLAMLVGVLYDKRRTQEIDVIMERKNHGSLAVLSAAVEKQQKDIINEAPIETIISSSKYVEFKDQTTLLDKRLVAEFKTVTDPSYKKPLEGKERLPKIDKDARMP